MRPKARRYQASIASATFALNSDAVAVTGDFEGGFVLATASVNANVGANQWLQAVFAVDGVQQGAGPVMVQVTTNASVVLATTLRVPQGRHRIALKFNAGAAPAASSCTGEMTVAELGA